VRGRAREGERKERKTLTIRQGLVTTTKKKCALANHSHSVQPPGSPLDWRSNLSIYLSINLSTPRSLLHILRCGGVHWHTGNLQSPSSELPLGAGGFQPRVRNVPLLRDHLGRRPLGVGIQRQRATRVRHSRPNLEP